MHAIRKCGVIFVKERVSALYAMRADLIAAPHVKVAALKKFEMETMQMEEQSIKRWLARTATALKKPLVPAAKVQKIAKCAMVMVS
jgi:hypothetical protein